ncbi:MAG: NAD(P)H-dependent oxidoreductase subunit E [Tepidiformaceae bacterium]
MVLLADLLHPRSRLLPLLHETHERDGHLSRESVALIARSAGIPVAEAWEAATSYPSFSFAPPTSDVRVCTGLSCALNGAVASTGGTAVGCQFRCFDAPAPGADAAFPETSIRQAGPLLAPDIDDWVGLDSVRQLSQSAALDIVEQSGLRGRGGAYFPAGRKWRAAIDEQRPIALVVNAEEGEPGVFKDRALLGRRPRRFLEGLAIAAQVLQPAVIVIFINGEARAARESLERTLAAHPGLLPNAPVVIPGGGGYVLGEETTLLNAIEGRKPVPRLRPPYPVESGLYGMPTVINNVETLANLSIIFRDGPDRFRTRGTTDAPGTKLLSISGRVQRPGLYEFPLGTPLSGAIALAGGAIEGQVTAVLAGGPSGGFLPASELHRPLLPGLMHPTGAVTGSGGMVVLDSTSDIRAAALAMAAFNAVESCGKCTPYREGNARVLDMLVERNTTDLDDLLEVVGVASLSGLGQMAPGPVRSARLFWPELFE